MMEKTKITSSLEDYIEAIAEIIELKGHAHTKDIANKLNVKMPSVTNALQVLSTHGLVTYNPHYPVELTEAGQKLGAEIIRRHKVLEKFFRDILQLKQSEASDAACKIEHVVSAGVVDRFILLSEAIESREDCDGLRNYLNQRLKEVASGDMKNLISLSELAEGQKAVIARMSENMKGVKKFANMGLVNGAEVEMEGRAPLGNLIRVKLLGSSLSLRSADAANILVSAI